MKADDGAAKVAAKAATDSTHEIHLTSKPSTWVLDVQDEQGNRRVPLSSGRLVIGSASECDVVVRDPTVSSVHCALRISRDAINVEDLGSKNGTYLGSARIREAVAGPGTTITIGRSTLISWASYNDEEIANSPPLAGVSGDSMAMRRLAAQVRRLARLSAPVLISGETGTGKELIARALHAEGPRANQSFVALNVAALPRDLVESELFGHERGAFTGAVSKRTGAFVEAAAGTLFLDEIGELPLDSQPKLLRALDGYEVRRVGSSGGGRNVSARLVAATHVPLEKYVEQGMFRRDLYHRLEVFIVNVPPLRERKTDIAAISSQLLLHLAPEIGRRELTPPALSRLVEHDWPGNVRELRNVLYRAADLATRPRVLGADDIDRGMRVRHERKQVELTPTIAKTMFREHGENLSSAARAANIPRTTFRKLLKS